MIKIGVNFEKFGYLLETKERFFVRRELRTFAVQLAKYQSSNNKQVAKKKVKENKKERNNQNQNVFSRCHSAIFKEPFQISPLHTPLFPL